MDTLQWMLQNAGDTLLLVAVDARAAHDPGHYPCRVVGTFSQEEPLRTADDGLRITRLLADIGVPGNLLGCSYLRTALSLLLKEPELGRTITRSLYPRIAQTHHTTAQSVERAIRHAISQTFARCGSDGYRSALGRLASSVGEKPTNAEFLAQTAECLRLGA